MPFRESSPVEERIALFREYESGAFSVVELCDRFGISRDTFYVWKRRRDADFVSFMTFPLFVQQIPDGTDPPTPRETGPRPLA